MQINSCTNNNELDQDEYDLVDVDQINSTNNDSGMQKGVDSFMLEGEMAKLNLL